MVSTELMIGDWVLKDEEYIKVTDIYENNGVYYLNDDTTPITSVKPIPLTAEIFEKNGFDKFLGLGPFFCKYIKNQEVSITIDVLFCKDSHIVVDIEKRLFANGTRNDLHNCDIQALHELQHALRLCGLNEFADDFKMEE
jgi:hypothetical protein